jgi:cysteinyl-tRNA synthetase
MDDDLGAPQAVASVFAFVTAGNAALDAGERPGPRALAAWERAEDVLGVTSDVRVVRVTGADTMAGGDLAETPPNGAGAAEWARSWALRRKQAKAERNYPEADRIRAMLRGAGWEVRDNKDGSIEVVQARVLSG